MGSSLATSKFEVNRFALMLSKYSYKVKLNDILAGTIIGLESTHALVDIGLNKAAFLPLKEINIQVFDHPKQILYINFVGEFLILSINEKTGQIVVSLKQVHYMCLWERIKQMDFKNTIIYAKNYKPLGKGKILSFGGLKVFALNSHIPKYYRRKKDKNFLMPFKFIEIRDIVHLTHVNSKLAIFPKLSQNLEIGGIYRGNIISIKSFGIFINILGVQCLLHISEISKDKILNINNLYKQGDQIKVKIIYKSIEQGKISVTLKRLEVNRPLQL